jgi:hypothetical protein
MGNSSSGLSVTPSLRNALLDLYFRETCDQQGWAYVAAPKDISFREKNTLAFRKGQRQVQVKVHEQLVQEIEKTAPAFDYLACKVGKQEGMVVASPLALCWVKTRGGKEFTDGQLDAMGRIKLPVAVFSVRDVLVPPTKIETKWEAKSAKEWLDEIDDRREEAESDDDYL